MFFLCESIWHSAMQKAPNVASMFFACIMWDLSSRVTSQLSYSNTALTGARAAD